MGHVRLDSSVRGRCKKTVGGEGGALMPPGFPLFRSALFPEFDRLFDGFLRDWELPVMGRKAWRWDVEVEEKADEIVVRAEAPGFEPEEFEVEVRDELLVLHAVKEKKPERKDEEEEGGRKGGIRAGGVLQGHAAARPGERGEGRGQVRPWRADRHAAQDGGGEEPPRARGHELTETPQP